MRIGVRVPRGDADHAFARPYLRSHARLRIAAARDRVEPLARRVVHQHHGMLDAEVVAQAVQQAVEQCREVGRVGHSRDGRAQRRDVIDRGRIRQQRRVVHPGDRFDAVHVGAAQLEYPGHSAVRRDAGELCLHALEQRAGLLGAQVAHREPVLRARVRMDDDHRRARILQHVLPRLAEELERQRDMLAIDVVHLRYVGDVRRAVQRAGRDHRRHGAVQCGADRLQRRCRHWLRSRSPAPGPGVCWNAAVGVKVMAARPRSA